MNLGQYLGTISFWNDHLFSKSERVVQWEYKTFLLDFINLVIMIFFVFFLWTAKGKVLIYHYLDKSTQFFHPAETLPSLCNPHGNFYYTVYASCTTHLALRIRNWSSVMYKPRLFKTWEQKTQRNNKAVKNNCTRCLIPLGALLPVTRGFTVHAIYNLSVWSTVIDQSSGNP